MVCTEPIRERDVAEILDRVRIRTRLVSLDTAASTSWSFRGWILPWRRVSHFDMVFQIRYAKAVRRFLRVRDSCFGWFGHTGIRLTADGASHITGYRS